MSLPNPKTHTKTKKYVSNFGVLIFTAALLKKTMKIKVN